MGVGERRTPRASYVRRPTRTRAWCARARAPFSLARYAFLLSPTPLLLLWWALRFVCVSSYTSSPRFRGDEPPRKAEQLVTPTTNCAISADMGGEPRLAGQRIRLCTFRFAYRSHELYGYGVGAPNVRGRRAPLGRLSEANHRTSSADAPTSWGTLALCLFIF